jgi:ankyrin repeat protein
MENLDQQMLTAAQQNDLGAVKSLVAQGADINYNDKWGNSAIFSAAWEGNIEALDLFYSLGANIKLGESDLLMNAAYNAKVNSVKWMIEKGADVNHTLKNGENALHYTISNTNHMPERTEIVKILIDAGIDIHKKTIAGQETLCFMRDAFLKGETPLHRAAAYANEAIIKLLIEAGADPSVKDVNGDTPISWGSWHLRPNSILGLFRPLW